MPRSAIFFVVCLPLGILVKNVTIPDLEGRLVFETPQNLAQVLERNGKRPPDVAAMRLPM